MSKLTRRAMLLGMAGAGLFMARGSSYGRAMQDPLEHLTPEQRASYQAMVQRMLAALPYERVTVPGDSVLGEWERLKREGGALPVVLGSDEALERIADQFSLDDPAVFGAASPAVPPRSVESILTAAAGLQFPADLARWPGAYTEEDLNAPVGEWPQSSEGAPGLAVARDVLTGVPFERVHILLIPTDQSWKVPAYLRWGDWNACPPPEQHVAALRSWSDRFGAELVGIDADTMNLRVARRPGTRAEALALAREQYRYCPDIVDQGVRTLAALARALMDNDWWFFWWD